MTEQAGVVREATHHDVEAINRIYNEAVLTTTATFDTSPKSIQQQQEWFEAFGDRYPILVMDLDGQVAGWSCLRPWSPKPAYRFTAETTFYVAENFRGRGFGRRLKSATINEAERLGFHTLLARVVVDSEASLHLNQDMGFEIIGKMKQVGFKFDQWLDVYLLQKMLSANSNVAETGSSG